MAKSQRPGEPPSTESIEPDLETADTIPTEDLKAVDDLDPAPTPTTPTNWWLYGLIGLAVVVVILFAMQLVTGAPGTDVEEGTPVAESVDEQTSEQAAE